MATISVRWTVSSPATVLATYDVQRVWRTASLSPPTWAEATGPATRVPIGATQTSYVFDDASGSIDYTYSITFYNTVTLAESDRIFASDADLAGYVTIDDVRAEGFTAAVATDAQVARGILRATAMIDRVTNQWFLPRSRTFDLDGRRGSVRDLLLDVPIIALTRAAYLDDQGDEEEIASADLYVYNRHLTQGMLDPDDRYDPRLTWRENTTLPSEIAERRWLHGRRNIRVAGVFGFTELGPADVPGETSPGSQVPLSYGIVPPLIQYAALLLTTQYMFPLAGGEGEQMRNRSRLTSETTRDQSYTLAAPAAASQTWGFTGNLEVDSILAGFRRFDAGAV